MVKERKNREQTDEGIYRLMPSKEHEIVYKAQIPSP